MNRNRLPRDRAPGDPLLRLWNGSALVGLTDAELLARFVATGDGAAFEGLVVRLGPMVLGVCRRMLGDRGDADDAFQATFLVLVRRARAVGRGELIGPWLHGVAVRVCRKARAQARRRRTREQSGLIVDGPVPVAAPPALDQAETRAAIDDAIARLPERYRRLVILCDVEELTRDEAADRLGWTPNMVRGRLARARTQLRSNLVRRGCVPPGFTTASATAAGTAELAALPWLLPPSPILLATTARVALAFHAPSGRPIVAALASTTALHLAEGVLRTMFTASWKVVGSALILGGGLAAGTVGALLAQTPGPEPAQKPAAAQPAPAVAPAPSARPDEALRRVENARDAYEAQRAALTAGKATVHDVVMADNALVEAEMAWAGTPEQRVAALRAEQGRIGLLQQDKQAAFNQGKATQDDLNELAETLREAGIRMARETATLPPIAPIVLPVLPKSQTLQAMLEDRRRSAQQRYMAQSAFYDEGRITIDRLIDASRQLMSADLDLATSADSRREIVQTYVNRLQRIYNREVAELEVGRATSADVVEAESALLEAKILLARNAPGPAQADDPPPASTSAPSRPVAPPANAQQVAEWQQARLEQGRKVFAEAKRLYPAELPLTNYLQAERDWTEIQLAAATTPEARAAALQSMIELARQTVAAVEALFRKGEATEADVARARVVLLDTQIRAADDGMEAKPLPAGPVSDLGRGDVPPGISPGPQNSPAGLPNDVRQMNERQRTRTELARQLFEEAARSNASDVKGPNPTNFQLMRVWPEIQLATAATQENPQASRAAALQAMVDVEKQALAAAEAQVQAGRGSPIDVTQAKIALLNAQIRAAGGGSVAESPATADLDRRLSDVERKLDRVLDLLNSRLDRSPRR